MCSRLNTLYVMNNSIKVSTIFSALGLCLSKTVEYRPSTSISSSILNEPPNDSFLPKSSTFLYDDWSKASFVQNHLNQVSFVDSKRGLNNLLTSLLSEIKFSLQLQFDSQSISKDSYDQQISAFNTLTQKLDNYFNDLNLNCLLYTSDAADEP